MAGTKNVVTALFLVMSFVVMQSSNGRAQEMCYADYNCDTKVNLADLVLIKGEFLRNDCAIDPCEADCNCDAKVDLSDLVTTKAEFLKNDCSACGLETGCTYPVTTSTTTTCNIEISYGRPGRRGIPLDCKDILNFTLCSDCDLVDPSCLTWTISPSVPWLSIAWIDDCCWRLIIDDHCGEPGSAGCYEITATDICNTASDTVIIEIL